MNIRNFGRLTMVAIASLGLAACGINSVPEKEEVAKEEWANVQSAYQRRADLVPNLIATVRSAAGAETQVLTNVTEARSRATSINITTDDLSNPEEFAKFQGAQNQLTQALGQVRTVVENYPDLQSQERFADLMVALEGAENRIDNARSKYNEAVRDYNTEVRTFPSSIGANIVHGADPMETFTSEKGADAAPDADFGSIDPANSEN